MRKNDSHIYIDELLLNVLGEEFFQKRKLKVNYVPTIPKNQALEKNTSLKDVS